MDTLRGSQIGQYRIQSLVAHGGMSSLYKAQHVWTQRVVAFKVLAPALAADERFRDRFARESVVLAALDHPNIVRIYDAGEDGDVLFIAMQFVEGSDLRTILARGAVSGERAVHLISQVAAGIDAAHANGLVHRDIKPANVLIGKSDHAYVADFGVVKGGTGAGLTGTAEFVGSSLYAAPEQFKGDVLDARSDVYSLGCVVYQCFAGGPPFDRASDAAVMYAHLETPVPVLAAADEVSARVDAVIARAMAKRPEDRYPSALALAEDLADAVNGVRLIRVPVAFPEPGRETTNVGADLPGSAAKPTPTTTIVRPGATPAAAEVVVGATGDTIVRETGPTATVSRGSNGDTIVRDDHPTVARPATAPERRKVLPLIAGVAVLAVGAVVAFVATRGSAPRAAPSPSVGASAPTVSTTPETTIVAQTTAPVPLAPLVVRFSGPKRGSISAGVNVRITARFSRAVTATCTAQLRAAGGRWRPVGHTSVGTTASCSVMQVASGSPGSRMEARLRVVVDGRDYYSRAVGYAVPDVLSPTTTDIISKCYSYTTQVPCP